jgi:hypothetical protein
MLCANRLLRRWCRWPDLAPRVCCRLRAGRDRHGHRRPGGLRLRGRHRAWPTTDGHRGRALRALPGGAHALCFPGKYLLGLALSPRPLPPAAWPPLHVLRGAVRALETRGAARYLSTSPPAVLSVDLPPPVKPTGCCMRIILKLQPRPPIQPSSSTRRLCACGSLASTPPSPPSQLGPRVHRRRPRRRLLFCPRERSRRQRDLASPLRDSAPLRLSVYNNPS